MMKKLIIAALRNGEFTHSELFERVGANLRNGFDGNVNWYAETVKLDLEARRIIERTSSKPQKYRLI